MVLRNIIMSCQYFLILGTKFSVVKDFQIGVKGVYENYQMDASSSNPAGTEAYPQPQSSVGGLVNVGLTH